MDSKNGTLVVLARLLIDGTGQDPVRDAAVVIEGGRISQVGPRSRVTVKRNGTSVLDVGDRAVTPGLIDSHCHLFHIGRGYGAPTVSFIARAIQNAGLWLDTGVTTVRDISTRENLDLGLRDAINAGLVRGPRMFVSGSGIAATGGGPLGEEPKRFVIEVTGPDQARRVARQQLRAGVDFIKMFATSGVTEGTKTELTVDEMRAAVEEAHKAGKHAAGHAFSAEGIRNVLAAGVDTVEHGTYLDEEGVAIMKARDVVLVPTLSIIKTFAFRGAQWGRPFHVQEYGRRALGVAMNGVRMARAGGVRVAAGTDPPYIDTVPMECACLVEAGLAPMEAIVAATRTGAEILGRSVDFGTIEVGKRADMAAFAGDPLEDIAALGRAEYVIKGGVVVKAP